MTPSALGAKLTRARLRLRQLFRQAVRQTIQQHTTVDIDFEEEYELMKLRILEAQPELRLFDESD